MAKVVPKPNESFDSMLRRFKKSVNNDGLIQELRRREYYLSPSQKRRAKDDLAMKRMKKKKR